MKYLKSLRSKDLRVTRRKFMGNATRAVGGVMLLGLEAGYAERLVSGPKKEYTVQEIIDLILREGNLKSMKATVDTIKAGSPDQIVTGIVTTMFATITVIEEAVKRNANFIIAHEPSFYNHSDNPEWVKNNGVTLRKQQLLNEHKIAVWRFHDYCHALNPDAISYGVAKKAHWLPHYKPGEVMLTIPPVSLTQLVQHLKTSLGIAHLRIIGNPEQKCERIGLLPGAWGGQRQVSVIESEKPDVLIVGEVSEWETAEYIRDALSLGDKTSLIILGHAVSEEPGMEWFAEWLAPRLQGLKVSHLASNDPFIWI